MTTSLGAVLSRWQCPLHPLVVLEGKAKWRAGNDVLAGIGLVLYRPLLAAVQPEGDVAWQPVHGDDMPLGEVSLDLVASLVIVMPVVQELSRGVACWVEDLGEIDLAFVRPFPVIGPQEGDGGVPAPGVCAEPDFPAAVRLMEPVADPAGDITKLGVNVSDELEVAVAYTDGTWRTAGMPRLGVQLVVDEPPLQVEPGPAEVLGRGRFPPVDAGGRRQLPRRRPATRPSRLCARRSRDQENECDYATECLPVHADLTRCAWSSRSMTKVAGLLGGPFPSGMQGDSEDSDAPGGVVYHGQDVGLSAVEQVGGEEVAGQDHLGLGAQELRPGRPGSARRGVDSGVLQNFPCRRRRYLHSQAG
jgi:hypothetical protein